MPKTFFPPPAVSASSAFKIHFAFISPKPSVVTSYPSPTFTDFRFRVSSPIPFFFASTPIPSFFGSTPIPSFFVVPIFFFIIGALISLFIAIQSAYTTPQQSFAITFPFRFVIATPFVSSIALISSCPR